MQFHPFTTYIPFTYVFYRLFLCSGPKRKREIKVLRISKTLLNLEMGLTQSTFKPSTLFGYSLAKKGSPVQ